MSSIQAYHIIEKMASGSFGVVFKVERIADHKIFVMKRIPLENLSASERQQAVKEFYLMSELCHPFIVHQYEAFLFNDNDLCLIIEYYDGGDMDQAVRVRRDDEDSYFPFRGLMFWLAEVLLAVHYLHSKGIIHRDLKAHNIFFDKRRNDIAVGDFGISEKIEPNAVHNWMMSLEHSYDTFNLQNGTTLEDNNNHVMQEELLVSGSLAQSQGTIPNKARATSPHNSPVLSPTEGERFPALKGTPLYMSPETLQGAASSSKVGSHPSQGRSRSTGLGQKADVWSLGCILYELLSLRHPFYARDMGLLVLRVTRGERAPLPAHYPREIVDLVNRMLELNPEHRPSCKEVLRTPVVSAFTMELLLERGLLQPGATSSEEVMELAPEPEGVEGNRQTDESVPPLHVPRSATESLLKQLRRLKLAADPELARVVEEAVDNVVPPPPSAEHAEVQRHNDSVNARLRLARVGSSSIGSFFTPHVSTSFAGAAPPPPRRDSREGVATTTELPPPLLSSRDSTPARRHRSLSSLERQPPTASSATARSAGWPTTAPPTADGHSPPRPHADAASELLQRHLVENVFPCPAWWNAPGLENVEDLADAPAEDVARELETMRCLLHAVYRQRAMQRGTLHLLQQFRGAKALPASTGRRVSGAAMHYSLLGVEDRLVEEADAVSRHLADEVEELARPASFRNVHQTPLSPRHHSKDIEPALLPYVEERERLYHFLFPPAVEPEREDSTFLTSSDNVTPREHSQHSFTASSPSSHPHARQGVHPVAAPLTREQFESVYIYYEETELLRRDPHRVRQIVPQRQAWVYLPMVEKLVWLDRWLRRAQGLH